MNASSSASTSIVTPTNHVRSRGLRNAPVKKTRKRWRMTAAMKTFAAQWWVCLIRSPALTDVEMSSTDL